MVGGGIIFISMGAGFAWFVIDALITSIVGGEIMASICLGIFSIMLIGMFVLGVGFIVTGIAG